MTKDRVATARHKLNIECDKLTAAVANKYKPVVVARARRAVDAAVRKLGEAAVAAELNAPIPKRSEIEILLKQGVSQPDLVQRFGVSRQYINQIAHSLDIRSPPSDKLDPEIAVYFKEGHTIKECAVRFEKSKLSIRKALAASGIDTQQRKEARWQPLVQRVKDGESGLAVAGSASKAGMLYKWCKKLGVISSHGRWRSFDQRRNIIIAGCAAGKNWSEITQMVMKAEGSSVNPKSIYQWTLHNMPELVHQKRESTKSKSTKE